MAAMKPIYLDYAATAPIGAAARSAMLEWLGRPGNAHAAHHAAGSDAARAVRHARTQIADRIAGEPDGLVFTSGATEANNLLLSGLAVHLRGAGRTHLITTSVEHKSILSPMLALREQGFSVTILPVQACGMIEAEMIEAALTPQTGLVSVQAVNNELGTIQPLEEIAAMLRGRGILFHSDASQALGKIDFSVPTAGVDFASLSSHKAYGPQGIGALYCKPALLSFLKPVLRGGGQEQGLRPGTLPVALCAGFGAACADLVNEKSRIQALREGFIGRLDGLDKIIHGHAAPEWNVPGILNLRFPGIDSETLVMELPGLAFGVGSACASAGNELSHVIQSVTGSDQAAREAIRLSFGRFTTQQEMDSAADQLRTVVATIKNMREAA